MSALLGGRLSLAQPASGYRVNVDAFWLAAFAAAGGRPARHVVDLGAGIGTVGLTLLLAGATHATLVEPDPELAALATENAGAFAARATVVDHDVRAPAPKALLGVADLVVCNPPYGVTGRSRPAALRHARARQGEPGLLSAFARTTRAVLGPGGRACFVYPPSELSTLLAALDSTGLPVKRLRLVHPLPGRAASVALVEVKPARPGGTRVEPPFVAMTEPGRWSDEAHAILEGEIRFRDARRRAPAP